MAEAVFGAAPLRSGVIGVGAGLVRAVDAPEPWTSVDVRVVPGSDGSDGAPGAWVESGSVGPVVERGIGSVVTAVVGAATVVAARPGRSEKVIAAQSASAAAISQATIARRGVAQRGRVTGGIGGGESRRLPCTARSSAGRQKARRLRHEVRLRCGRPSRFAGQGHPRRERNPRHPS